MTTGLTFLYPWIFWAGLAASAVPVIIHLLMRTRPRLVIFPALRFVHKTQMASISKQRLKNLLLLLMRMAAFVLIGCIIAGTKYTGPGTAEGTGLLQSAVIVLDNSGSMTARADKRSGDILTASKKAASGLIDSLPDGSRMAIVCTNDVHASAGFVTDKSVAASLVAQVQEGYGSESLQEAIGKASALLAKSPIPLKRVYIFTDMTSYAWRDAAKISGDVQYIVVDCGLPGRPVNFALGDLKLSACRAAVGADVVVDVPVTCRNAGGQVELRLELDGKPAEAARADLPAEGSTTVSFTFTATRAGLLRGAIVMDVPDSIAADNIRYFTVIVAPQTELTIVRDPATASRGDQTAFLMGSAIAAGPFAERTVMADKLDPASLPQGSIVMLADVSGLSEQQWRQMDKFVREGGKLWVIIGELVSITNYSQDAAQMLMPVKPSRAQEMATGISWKADNLSDPMLSLFADGGNGSLSEVKCRRRLTVESVVSDGRVILAYSDGVPAIAVRKAGEGQVVFWNFSPDPAFSNLARLGQFVVLASHTAELLGSIADDRTMFYWGRAMEIPFPRGMIPNLATISAPGRPQQSGQLDLRHRTLSILKPDVVGQWEIAFSDGQKTVLTGASVNVASAESNLSRDKAANLAPYFEPGCLTVVNGAEGVKKLDVQAGGGQSQFDLTVPLLIAVLVLLAGESYFANRFYRRKYAALPDASGG